MIYNYINRVLKTDGELKKTKFLLTRVCLEIFPILDRVRFLNVTYLSVHNPIPTGSSIPRSRVGDRGVEGRRSTDQDVLHPRPFRLG